MGTIEKTFGMSAQQTTALQEWLDKTEWIHKTLQPHELGKHIADVMRERLEAQAAPAWQPIETAPKDGETLLLGYRNKHGHWRTVRGQWMSEDYIQEYWEEPDNGSPGWFEDSVEADDVPNCWPIEPTHWMPLPAAPKE